MMLKMILLLGVATAGVANASTIHRTLSCADQSTKMEYVRIYSKIRVDGQTGQGMGIFDVKTVGGNQRIMARVSRGMWTRYRLSAHQDDGRVQRLFFLADEFFNPTRERSFQAQLLGRSKTHALRCSDL